MRAAIRRRLYQHLLSISMALSASSAAAAAELLSIPAEVLSELVEELESGPGGLDERQRLIRLVALDARPAVRAQAATAAAVLWPERREAALEVLEALARDPSELVRAASAAGLARTIARAAPPERIQLVCDWVTSSEPELRTAIGRALTAPTPAFVTDIALECLAHDSSAKVRAAALVAAAAHFDEAPSLYGDIAARLASDPDRGVRKTARGLLNSRKPPPALA